MANFLLGQSAESEALQERVRGENTRWILSPEEILEMFEITSTGGYYDRNANEWKTDPKLAVINKRGAQMIANILRKLLNKNSYLSNLDENEIRDICFDACKEFIMLVVSEMKSDTKGWKLERDYAGMLIEEFSIMLFAGLMRAKDEGERASLRSQERTTRIITDGKDPGRKLSLGIFGKGDSKE